MKADTTGIERRATVTLPLRKRSCRQVRFVPRFRVACAMIAFDVSGATKRPR